VAVNDRQNMSPEMQLLFNIVAGIAGFFGAVLMKSQWDSIKDLRESHDKLNKRHAEIEVLVAGQYAKRDEVERLGEAIFRKLDRIEEKLDQKADKA